MEGVSDAGDPLFPSRMCERAEIAVGDRCHKAESPIVSVVRINRAGAEKVVLAGPRAVYVAGPLSDNTKRGHARFPAERRFSRKKMA